MKHTISNFIYKNVMVKGLSRLINEGYLPAHQSDTPIALDETARLTFIGWGDPQISFLSPLRSARVYAAMRDIKEMKGKADALLLAGDITEYGLWCEYRMMAQLLDKAKEQFDAFFAVPGNHDVRLRRYQKQRQRFFDFIDLLPGGVHGNGPHYYFSHWYKDYLFVFMGADKSAFEASYISEEQLRWLDRQLKAGTKNGKPVFVINHQPLRRTNGLPDAWLGNGDWRGDIGAESDKVRAIMEKYQNIIFITGHLHYGTSAYNYEDLGAIKAVSLPTIGVINHGNNDTPSQGFLFEVYDDKITVTARYHGEGCNVSEDIENHQFEIQL